MVHVVVTGYGAIGKRVTDAVRAMPDMELVGVADVATDWWVQTAIGKDLDLYAATNRADETLGIRQRLLPDLSWKPGARPTRCT